MNSAEADLGEELSLASVLYQAVRANIESGRLPPGTLLNEHRLAQQLAVSRAPISRMLQRLAADGVLIRLEPRGYRVPGAGASVVRGTPILELPPDALGIVRGRAGWEKIWDQVEKDLVACMPFGRFKINELAMAEYYGVSRTVTRDLLGRLEARNLAEKVGRSQRFLRELTPELMNDLYEVRRLLEPTALVSAAPRLSRSRLEEMRADLLRGEEKYPNLSAADIARYEDEPACRMHRSLPQPLVGVRAAPKPAPYPRHQSSVSDLSWHAGARAFPGRTSAGDRTYSDQRARCSRGRPRRPSSQRGPEAANKIEGPQGAPSSDGPSLLASGRRKLAQPAPPVSGRLQRRKNEAPSPSGLRAEAVEASARRLSLSNSELGRSATIRPTRMQTMRSATPSNSSRSDDVTQMLMPASASLRTRAWIPAFAFTSTPRVKSLRRRTRGRASSERASNMRCWLPPERRSTHIMQRVGAHADLSHARRGDVVEGLLVQPGRRHPRHQRRADIE